MKFVFIEMDYVIISLIWVNYVLMIMKLCVPHRQIYDPFVRGWDAEYAFIQKIDVVVSMNSLVAGLLMPSYTAWLCVCFALIGVNLFLELHGAKHGDGRIMCAVDCGEVSLHHCANTLVFINHLIVLGLMLAMNNPFQR